MGQDGYPNIWMKFSRKQDDANVEVKPYRVSFVRAALLVTTARQEAQYQVRSYIESSSLLSIRYETPVNPNTYILYSVSNQMCPRWECEECYESTNR